MASAACHRADGGGLVGPAFTDNSYIHGGRYADIAMIITEGVADKGMIASSKQLKQEEMQDLTCDVRALRDSTVEDAKAPQGTKAVDAVVPMPWRRLTLRPPSPGPQRPGARFARAPPWHRAQALRLSSTRHVPHGQVDHQDNSRQQGPRRTHA